MREYNNYLALQVQICENSIYDNFVNYDISEMERTIAEARQILVRINSFIDVELSLQDFLGGIPKPKSFKLH